METKRIGRRRISFRKYKDMIRKDERNRNTEINKIIGRYKLMWQNISSLMTTVTNTTKNYFN